MGNCYKDWYRQAQADLEHARHSLDVGDYERSCFAAHQAAEKAETAIHHAEVILDYYNLQIS